MDILDLMREQDGDDLAHIVDSIVNGDFEMKAWKIYHENEKTGKREYLGMWYADTMAEALEKAAEYYEYDQGDLIAIQEM